MKVAIIDPSLFTWPYDIALAEGLAENGHEVAIYGRAPLSPVAPDALVYLRPHFYAGLNADWIKKLPHKIFLGLKGFSHILSMLRLISVLRRERPDVIHFQWTPAPAADWLMLPLIRRIAPLILTVHDSQPFNGNPISRLQNVGSIAVMQRFDRLIVHTDKAKQRVESYGISPSRITRIAHGLLRTTPRGSEKLRIKPAGDRLTLLLFGFIKPYKGTDILLRAVAKLPEPLRRRCRVLIVGRPRIPMPPLYQLIETLGLSSQVDIEERFIDEDEIGDLLQSADIQVFPYTEIDASGVLMQVLAFGKPIIASQIGIFSELLDGARHGGLVPPNNIDALSAAISKLVANSDLREGCGRAVAKLSNSIPAWPEIGRHTAMLYEDAVTERKGV